MQKIVINTQFGGFGLSRRGQGLYMARRSVKLFYYERVTDSDEGIKYVRVAPTEDAMFLYAVTKDLGEETKELSDYFSIDDIKRDDPDLVAIVEEHGHSVVGAAYATLKVVEIPDDVEWQIEEYDGNEWIAEVHRTWR